MAEFEIVRARRSQARLRLGLAAPSGGGKTWSALLVAKGLVEALQAAGAAGGGLDGKIGVIDTERSSAQLYSHLVPFDTIDLAPPYTVDRYLGALRQFERAGYLVVIVDQVTHAWSGAGGILELVDQAARKASGNTFSGWQDGTPEYQRFVDGLLSSSCHLICTMRQKTRWDLVETQNRAGRMVKTPTRIGMAPEQRAGFEYELTTLLGLSVSGNVATNLKDRSGLFGDIGAEVGRLDESVGARLAGWLTTGAVLAPEDVPPLEQLAALLLAGERMCEQAKTGPDLARAFESQYRRMRRFIGEVEQSQVQGFLDRLVAAKDAAKARFPELQAVYARARAETAATPAPAKGMAQQMVDTEAVRRHGPDLVSAASDPFSDMPDDLPWKD